MAGDSRGGRNTIIAALIGAVAIVVAALIPVLLSRGGGGDNGATPTPTSAVTASPTAPSTPSPTVTASPTPEEPTPTPAVPLTFLERVAGEWQLDSWTEAAGPVTLGIEVLNGTLTVNGPDQSDPGTASWRMDIQQVNRPTSPQPGLLCGGQTTLSGTIEGVPGGATNAVIDWTVDLDSINHSSTGEDLIQLALCGWALLGDRAPFNVALEGADTAPATRMEMANEGGTFRWSRP